MQQGNNNKMLIENQKKYHEEYEKITGLKFDNKKIIIHVGLPRTGTTFLQKEFFPKIKNAFVYGPFNKYLCISSKFEHDKINIISDELLSIDCLLDRIEQREEVLLRLKILFPSAKIIFVLRDKESFQKSFYSEYIKWGGTKPYYDWYIDSINKNPNVFDFSQYVTLINSLFDEVLILDYTEFIENKKVFLKKICDFIDVDIPQYRDIKYNVRLDDRTIKRWRRINKHFKFGDYENQDKKPSYLNPLFWYNKLTKLLKP